MIYILQTETQKVKAHYLKMLIAKVESTSEVSIRFSFFHQGYKITFSDESTTWQFTGVVKEIIPMIGTRPFKYYVSKSIDFLTPLLSEHIFSIENKQRIENFLSLQPMQVRKI